MGVGPGSSKTVTWHSSPSVTEVKGRSSPEVHVGWYGDDDHTHVGRDGVRWDDVVVTDTFTSVPLVAGVEVARDGNDGHTRVLTSGGRVTNGREVGG